MQNSAQNESAILLVVKRVKATFVASNIMDAYDVTSVKVSGVALLKIIKHCEGETLLANEHVTGMLFGLVVGDTLEITNCCPLPKIPEDDQNMEAIAEYEAYMIKSMRDVSQNFSYLFARLIMIISQLDITKVVFVPRSWAVVSSKRSSITKC